VSGSAAIWLAVAIALPTASGYAYVLGRQVLRRWRQRVSTAPTGPTIERLGADVRRLHRLLDEIENAPDRPGKRLRSRATLDAYVDALRAACARLEVPPPAGPPVSRAEIYRVESDLRACGLEVRSRD
jgi:hypothetical protein